jgi:hypothetical protein
MVRRPRVIFVELKAQRTRVTSDQWCWLDELMACSSVETYLWRPSAWPTIEKILR